MDSLLFIGILLHLEIQKKKDEMKEAQYAATIGSRPASVLRLVEASAYCGHPRNDERKRAQTGKEAEYFEGDSWFASVKVCEEIHKAGHNFFGPVKTCHKFFPLAEIEKLMKEWPSGSHLVLECKTPNDINLFAVGYKYNKRKVSRNVDVVTAAFQWAYSYWFRCTTGPIICRNC